MPRARKVMPTAPYMVGTDAGSILEHGKPAPTESNVG